MISSSKVTLYTQSTLALAKISEISQSQDICLTFSKPVFTIFESGSCLPTLATKNINIFVVAGNGAGIADILIIQYSRLITWIICLSGYMDKI